MRRLFSRRSVARLIAPVLALGALTAVATPASALSIVPGATADSTGITPIGWSVVGLDSNNTAVGPDEYPVGARLCTATPIVGTLSASWSWLAVGSTQDDTLIKLASLAPSYLTQTGFTGQTGIVSGQTCYDAYWNVKLTRGSSTYWQDRGYQISFSDDSGSLGTTDPARRIYVEKLVSQNRNTVASVSIDGGGNTVTPGGTYDFTVTGATSTSYDQLTFASIFPAPAFQLLDAHYTYSTATGLASDGYSDQTYNDSCLWQYMYDVKEEPGQCVDVGGSGGNITAHYTVRVSPTAAPGPVNVNTLIYDFSGSSFHYNSDYGSGAGLFVVNIAAPAQKSVTYHSNEPAGTITGAVPASESATVGSDYGVKAGTQALAGYVFGGWNTAADGTGTAYAPGDLLTMPDADVDLYAIWIPQYHYAVSYNTMGGTGGPETTTVTLGGQEPPLSTPVSCTAPTRTGYTFLGWKDETGTAYACEESVVDPGFETLIILYAQWGPNERTVNYDPNTEMCSVVTGSPVTDTSTSVADPYTVLAPTDASLQYSCTGGTFTGWKDSSGNSYPPGFVYTGTGPLTLIAQWATPPTPTYIVTYLGNGNTGGTQPIDAGAYATGETTTVEANTFTRTGYTFAGWNTAANGTGTAHAAGSTLTFASADITLYAQWTPIAPVINVKTGPADSTTVSAIETHTVGQPISGITVKPVGDGIIETYTVDCTPDLPADILATPTPNSGETATAASGVSISGTLALYAAIGTYHCVITAHGPGGTSTVDYTLVVQPMYHDLTTAVQGLGSVNVGPGVTSYESGTVVSILATPAHGQHFVKWLGDCADMGNPASVTMIQARNCTAVFEPNPMYPLTIETKGQGSVSPAAQYYEPLTKVTLKATPAAGWFFTGWGGACSGTAATCEVTMTSAKHVIASFVQGVTITTKANGSGTVQSSQPTGTPLLPGTKVTLTAEPASGWKFTGWSGSCSGTENPLTVTLEVSKDCTANFVEEPKPVTLVAKNDTYRVARNSTLRLPAGASILNNDGSSATNVQAVSKTRFGTLTLGSNGKLVYTPKKGFVGIDSFKYKAFDANGNSVIATVRIIVSPPKPTTIKTGR